MLIIVLYGIDLRQEGMICLLGRPFGGGGVARSARHRSLNRSVAHGYNRYNRNSDRAIPSFSFFLFTEAEDRRKCEYMYGIVEIV